ncbi:MAG: alpha-amylase, partial [Fervidobacterium sp.]
MFNKKYMLFLIATVLTLTFLLFSCTSSMTKPVNLQKAAVSVKVDTTLGMQRLGIPKINSFLDELAKVKLTVKSSDNTTVYSTETANKANIEFRFELEQAGNYTFIVEGLTQDNVIIFSGTSTQQIEVGQNNTVIINAVFENGTIRSIIEIDNIIWERYNVTQANLNLKKDMQTNGTDIPLTIQATQTFQQNTVNPGMWNVTLNITLEAKDQYTTPANSALTKSVSIPVKPARTSDVKFKVYFDSTRNEPQLAVVVTQINLPFITPVQNLSAVYNFVDKTLQLSWDHSEIGSTYYIYKEIKEVEGTTEYFYYELVGNTESRNFTIANYDQNEHNRISGVAINAVKEGKESGIAILKK